MKDFIAKRENGITHSMSTKNELLKVKFQFTEEQYLKIKKGCIPMEFGDRWFIFCELNNVYFHYWKGQCIYTMGLDNFQDTYVSKNIIVVKDEKIRRIKSTESEIIELTQLIKYSLLDGEKFEIIK